MNVSQEQRIQELSQMSLSQICAMQSEVFEAIQEARERKDILQEIKFMDYLDFLSIAEDIAKNRDRT